MRSRVIVRHPYICSVLTDLFKIAKGFETVYIVRRIRRAAPPAFPGACEPKTHTPRIIAQCVLGGARKETRNMPSPTVAVPAETFSKPGESGGRRKDFAFRPVRRAHAERGSGRSVTSMRCNINPTVFHRHRLEEGPSTALRRAVHWAHEPTIAPHP